MDFFWGVGGEIKNHSYYICEAVSALCQYFTPGEKVLGFRIDISYITGQTLLGNLIF